MLFFPPPGGLRPQDHPLGRARALSSPSPLPLSLPPSHHAARSMYFPQSVPAGKTCTRAQRAHVERRLEDGLAWAV